MLHRIHCAGLISFIATLAGGFCQAHAQGSGDESGDARSMADEAKKGNGAHGSSDDKRRSDPKGQSERSSSGDRRGNDSRPTQGPLAVPSRINEAFTYPIANGCQYSATVRGNVKSARAVNGEEPRYTPNLTVNAWVTCQNNTELRVTDSSLRETAMTRSQLEQAIELRGSLLAESSGRRCVYVPDFSLGDGRLAGVGVSYLCPTSTMGGGLADNQDGHSAGDDADSVGPSDNRATTEGRNHDGSHGANDRRGPYERSDRGENRDNGRDHKGSSSDDGQ
jgi:hypothetical protein